MFFCEFKHPYYVTVNEMAKIMSSYITIAYTITYKNQ